MSFLFSESEWVSKEPDTGVALCGACGLHKKCNSPKLPVTGKGLDGVLIVGSGVSKASDTAGRMWSGPTGNKLRKTLGQMGRHHSDFWFYNSTICHGKPTSDNVRHCRPNIHAAIDELKPRHIICMGYQAWLSVAGRFAGTDDLGMQSTWDGATVPNQRPNCWVTCLDSPSLLDSHDGMREEFFNFYLREALKKEGRPWPDGPPNYEDQIKVCQDPAQAAKIIRKMVASGGLTAFDFEATTLEQTSEYFHIVSCAICWRGKRTVAFPWIGEAEQAGLEYLKSPGPKVAANMKYEDRACLAVYGHHVRNVVYDTVLGAHVVDNRPMTISVKHQAYRLLGQPRYNDQIEPFFKSDGPNKPNQIHQIEPKALLLYNGMDAVLEYHIAVQQCKTQGYKLKED